MDLLFRPRTLLVTPDRRNSSPPTLRIANIIKELCLSPVLCATSLPLVLTIVVPVELCGTKRDNSISAPSLMDSDGVLGSSPKSPSQSKTIDHEPWPGLLTQSQTAQDIIRSSSSQAGKFSIRTMSVYPLLNCGRDATCTQTMSFDR